MNVLQTIMNEVTKQGRKGTITIGSGPFTKTLARKVFNDMYGKEYAPELPFTEDTVVYRLGITSNSPEVLRQKRRVAVRGLLRKKGFGLPDAIETDDELRIVICGVTVTFQFTRNSDAVSALFIQKSVQIDLSVDFNEKQDHLYLDDLLSLTRDLADEGVPVNFV